MPKHRGELEAATGRLISAIQREWNAEAGEELATESETVMHMSHGLLLAAKSQTLDAELGGRTVAQYLGEDWVRSHPDVVRVVQELQLLIAAKHAV
jgi:hypothetical protein